MFDTTKPMPMPKPMPVFSNKLASKDAINAYKPPTAEQKANVLKHLDLEGANKRIQPGGHTPESWAHELLRRQTTRCIANNLMLPAPDLNIKSILPPRKWRARGTMNGLPKISSVLLNDWPVLNQSQVYVLQLLSHFAEIGVTFPVTQATMARTALLSTRTIRRALHKLVEKGLVEVASKGKRGVKTYRLKVPHDQALKIAEANAADHWKVRMQVIAETLGSKLFVPYTIPVELMQTRLLTTLRTLPRSAMEIMRLFQREQVEKGRVEITVRSLASRLDYAESVIQRSIRLLKQKGLVVDTGERNKNGIMIRTVPHDELGSDMPEDALIRYQDACAAAREAANAAQTGSSEDKQDDQSADAKCKSDKEPTSLIPQAAA